MKIWAILFFSQDALCAGVLKRGDPKDDARSLEERMHNYSWADDCRVYVTRFVRVTPLPISLEGAFPSAVAPHTPRSRGAMVMSWGSDFLAPQQAQPKHLTLSVSEISFLRIAHTRVVMAHLSSVEACAWQISTNLICQARREQSSRCTRVEGFGLVCLRSMG